MIAALALAAALTSPARAEGASPVAGSVVRSKDWIVRRGDKKEEEFVGDVRYDSQGTRLTADWALYQHATKVWTARGKVAMRKETSDGAVVEAAGETARYDESDRSGRLLPAPGRLVSFTRTPAGEEPDRGEGRRLDWESDAAATLTGDARVWGPRLQAWADSARYERALRRLTLLGGRPVLRKVDDEGGWTTALKADSVQATDSPRRIEARGQVVGWLVFKDEKKLHREIDGK